MPDLIPGMDAYYRQLLPALPEDGTLDAYVSKTLISLFRCKASTSDARWLKHALAVAGSAQITDSGIFDAFTDADLLSAFSSEGTITDPFSIVAGITECFRRFDTEGFEGVSRKLIERLTASDQTKRLTEIFAGAYILAAGHIPHDGYLRDKALFARRLAAFGHASLLTRIVVATGLESEGFCDWCARTNGKNFLIRALVEKRGTPRWRPEWIDPVQLQFEVLGRLSQIHEKFPDISKQVGLDDRITELEKKLDVSKGSWKPLYPGPLEGDLSESANYLQLQPEMIELIRESTTGKVGIERCIGIAAVSPIWSVTDELIEEATVELDRSPLPKDQDKRIAVRFALGGLAHIAGLKRSTKLAGLVASLSLRATHSSDSFFGYGEVLSAVVEASAAFLSRDQQIEWLANTITRFAFSARRPEDVIYLQEVIDVLMQCEPLLENKLLRARAALVAFAGSVAH